MQAHRPESALKATAMVRSNDRSVPLPVVEQVNIRCESLRSVGQGESNLT